LPGRVREGVKEAYNLFNEVADKLYGPEDLQQDQDKAAVDAVAGDAVEESGEEEEEDIDAAFEKVSSQISVFWIGFNGSE